MAGLFWEILTGVTLPIVLVAAVGWAAQTGLKLDRVTLNRLLVDVVFPCFLIHSMVTAEIDLSKTAYAAVFTVARFAVLLAAAYWMSALMGADKPTRAILGLAVAFPNSGNYGLPLTELAFGPALIPHQAVVVGVHSVMIVVAGVLMLSHLADSSEGRGSLLRALRAPMLPAIVIGLALNAADVTFPPVILKPLGMIAAALPAIALFVLGAQLADVKWNLKGRELGFAVVLKMLAVPALSWAALIGLGAPDDLTGLLTVIGGLPTGVLLAVVAAQYGIRPGLAAATVAVTTLLSPVTITLVLMAVG